VGGGLGVSGAWVGKEREEWQHFICGHSATPEALHCDRDAAWHGMRFEADGDMLAMSSCDEHKPILEYLCDYVHLLAHPCGIPGAMFRWPENECYTDWAETAEFAQLATAGAS
jgi:hypothetical protein